MHREIYQTFLLRHSYSILNLFSNGHILFCSHKNCISFLLPSIKWLKMANVTPKQSWEIRTRKLAKHARSKGETRKPNQTSGATEKANCLEGLQAQWWEGCSAGRRGADCVKGPPITSGQEPQRAWGHGHQQAQEHSPAQRGWAKDRDEGSMGPLGAAAIVRGNPAGAGWNGSMGKMRNQARTEQWAARKAPPAPMKSAEQARIPASEIVPWDKGKAPQLTTKVTLN